MHKWAEIRDFKDDRDDNPWSYSLPSLGPLAEVGVGGVVIGGALIFDLAVKG
jgi:hypothetical protein